MDVEGGGAAAAAAAATAAAAAAAAANSASSSLAPAPDLHEPMSSAVVLHEFKDYYASPEDVYGADVEVLVQEEDTQALEEPVLARASRLAHGEFMRDDAALRGASDGDYDIEDYDKSIGDKAALFSIAYLRDLQRHGALVRNVGFVGTLHHGKTSLLDLLVQQTHARQWARSSNARYTDTLKLEQDRRISLKSTPMSLVLATTRGKSYALNIIDVPGHAQLQGETVAAMRYVDGVVVVVDAVEGVLAGTRHSLRLAAREQVDVVLCISKVDRLILELKIPPEDAYHKLRHVIDEVNEVLMDARLEGTTAPPALSPDLGNVFFSAAEHGWAFTLESFATLYAKRFGGGFDASEMVRRLWGDVYYSSTTRRFTRDKKIHGAGERSFVRFCLEPLYKLYGLIVGEEAETLAAALAPYNVTISGDELQLDTRPLLRLVMSRFFGNNASGVMDACAAHVHAPNDPVAARHVVERTYAGPLSSSASPSPPPGTLLHSLLTCSPDGPLFVHVAKMYARDDSSQFDALGRVLSGCLRRGARVAVLGENYAPDDVEDRVECVASRLWLFQARYRIEVASAPAGSWVLIEGVDATILKTAAIVDASPRFTFDGADPAYGSRPLTHTTSAVVKVAVEPLEPSKLPKMVEGLRKINKSYPLISTRVEESGEHVVLGTGELQLDSALYDLRRLYADIEVKVADPSVAFCETVVETSSLKCFASTPNNKNRLTMIAEPLEKSVGLAIEKGLLSSLRTGAAAKQRATMLKERYGWDALAARSVWAFGADATRGPNVLLNDVLATEVDRKALSSVRDSIVSGFQWGCRQGPLCEEPVRGVKFRLLGAELSSDALARGGGQIIPTARRIVYSSFLTATPRLMEPMYHVEIIAPQDCVTAVFSVLARRRGHATRDAAIAGSPLYIIEGVLPVIESFGFEVDLRAYTQGQAFCQCTYDHYAVAPGDPLDTTIELPPLTQVPVSHLAREFLVKTRARKGLSASVSVVRFFDPALVPQLQQLNLV